MRGCLSERQPKKKKKLLDGRAPVLTVHNPKGRNMHRLGNKDLGTFTPNPDERGTKRSLFTRRQ